MSFTPFAAGRGSYKAGRRFADWLIPVRYGFVWSRGANRRAANRRSCRRVDLGAQRHIFCASPAYLSAHGQPRTDRELEHHHCIAYGRADGTVSPRRFSGSRPGDTERRVMPARLVVGDGEAQVAAVLAGCGITQLPTWLISRQLEEGTLVEVLPHLASEGLAINLVWIKSRQALPKVSALLEALAAGLMLPAGKAD